VVVLAAGQHALTVTRARQRMPRWSAVLFQRRRRVARPQRAQPQPQPQPQQGPRRLARARQRAG
jgi:hypothetical protein